jgi:hypothetical protein
MSALTQRFWDGYSSKASFPKANQITTKGLTFPTGLVTPVSRCPDVEIQESLKIRTQDAGHHWLTPVILATQEAEIRRIKIWSQPGQTVHETLPQKYPTQNRAGRGAQVVECLPSKCEALGSNLSTAKNKKIWEFFLEAKKKKKKKNQTKHRRTVIYRCIS